MTPKTPKSYNNWHFEDAKKYVVRNLTRLASERLKELLEDKHLYQKVSIDPTESVTSARSNMLLDEHILWFDRWVGEKLPLERMTLAKSEQVVRVSPTLPAITYIPTLVIQNIKLFCKKCERREAFSPAWYIDFAEETARPEAKNIIRFAFPASLPWGFQLLLLVSQCQSCQGEPEALLVRRTEWELSLQGRSPMENVEVPKYIPKNEAKFFRDSVIAFNSGKTLAALFYLRSFIEQFARRITGMAGKITGDKIMDAYNETVPLKHRESMPSLRDWYDKLSGPIHEAQEDVATYNAAKEEIEQHFKIRDVFKIPESALATSPKESPDNKK